MGSHEVYDAVVVGAGLGGLGAAVTLSQLGHRVCIVEQHYVPGGYCHSFQRNGFTFDAAVEYIGSCGEGGALQRLFRALGISQKLSFYEMDPNGFDMLLFPQRKVAVKKDIDEYESSLRQVFPDEQKAIEQYFDIIQSIWKEMHSGGISAYLWQERSFPTQCSVTTKWANKTLQDLFDQIGASMGLQAVLAGQWGDYGLPPHRASVLVHVTTIQHYHGGAYYPGGGVQTIPDALVEVLKNNGGEIRYRHRVEKISTTPAGYKKVQVANGEALQGRIVIINADVKKALDLVDGIQDVDPDIARQISLSVPSISSFQVYLGVDLDLEQLGLTSSNYWVSPSDNINACFESLYESKLPERIPFMLTSTTMKDRTGRLAPVGKHIVKIVALMPFHHFAKWTETRLGKRGREYTEFKRAIADNLIRQAEEIVPGLAKAVVVFEIGTPLTNISYTLSDNGAIYGTARTPGQFGSGSIPPVLARSGIYLAGASTLYHGVLGSLLSGYQVGLQVSKELLN